MKQAADRFTLDMFADEVVSSDDHSHTCSRIRGYMNSDDVSRIDWWTNPARKAMRKDASWALVYRHVRAGAKLPNSCEEEL